MPGSLRACAYPSKKVMVVITVRGYAVAAIRRDFPEVTVLRQARNSVSRGAITGIHHACAGVATTYSVNNDAYRAGYIGQLVAEPLLTRVRNTDARLYYMTPAEPWLGAHG